MDYENSYEYRASQYDYPNGQVEVTIEYISLLIQAAVDNLLHSMFNTINYIADNSETQWLGDDLLISIKIKKV